MINDCKQLCGEVAKSYRQNGVGTALLVMMISMVIFGIRLLAKFGRLGYFVLGFGMFLVLNCVGLVHSIYDRKWNFYYPEDGFIQGIVEAGQEIHKFVGVAKTP